VTESTSDRNPVDVLADEFSARLREGSLPSIEDYAEQNPELADEIRATFPSIAMMERLSQKEHTERQFERQTSRLTGHMTEMLGDFQIVREIGRGGMGIVYEAVEKSLKRRVALKVLGPGVAGSPKQIQRFIREAEAAARLHHTNIVPVYGIGEEQDLHFFAMQFIDGVPLSDVIRSVSGRPTRRDDSAASDGGTLAEKLLAPTAVNDTRTGSDSFSAAGAAQVLLSGTLKKRSINPVGGSGVGHSAVEQLSSGKVTVTESSDSNTGNDELQSLPHEQRTNAESLPSENAQPGSEKTLPEISIRYWRSIARIGSEVADALHYSHQHGVVHRDVKPSNLLLDRNGVVWVTDFGLARHEDQEGVTNTGDIVGTLRYMAPEQFSGESNSSSDIYSLGLTLYELLALRPAYKESRHGPLISQKTTSMPPILRSINRDIPRDLETITQKACATSPADRYATAAELAEDLRRFLDDRPVLARRATAAEQLWRWVRRNPVVASLSSATVVLLATVAVVFAVGQYRTSQALSVVNVQKSLLESQKLQLDQSLSAERKASMLARDENARAEKNLQLAVKAFDSIIDNIASRGVPQSLTLNLDDDELDDGSAESYDTVLTAADADLLETLLVFFDEFAGQNRTDLRAQSAIARKRVGDIQQRLGRFEEAEGTYKVALTAFETLSTQQPDDRQLVIAQARIHNEIAIAASRRGAFRGALNEHVLAKRLLQESPGVRESDDGKLELARTLGLLTTIGSRSGFTVLMALTRSEFSNGRSSPRGHPRGEGPPDQDRTRSGSPAAARPESQGSEDGRPGSEERGERRRPDDPPETDGRPAGNDRSETNGRPAGGGSSRDGRGGPGRSGGSTRGGYRNWQEMFRGASDQELAILQELIDAEPSRPDYRLALAIAWRNRVTVARIVNDSEMGKVAITTAIKHLEELALDFPDDPVYRFELADTLCIRSSRNNDAEVAAEFQERVWRAIALCEDLIESYPNVIEYQALMGTSLCRQAISLSRQKEFGPAAESFQQAINLQQPLAERFVTVSLYQVAYLQSLWGLSEVSLAQQETEAAIGHLDTAIDRLLVLTNGDSKSRMLERYLEKLRRRRREVTTPPVVEPSAPPAAAKPGAPDGLSDPPDASPRPAA
jgi:serine/threonine protein kinase